jgi:hypothetical protein
MATQTHKAPTKAQAIRTAKSRLGELADGISTIVAGIGRERVRLGVLVSEGADLHESFELGDWRDWAKSLIPGEANPTLYALRNTGAVARVLGDAVGDASPRSLTPLYRFIAAAKDDEGRTAAADVIRSLWAQAQDKARDGRPPTEDVVTSLVDKATPKGTRGSAKGKATSKGAKGKATAKATADPSVLYEVGSSDREACGQAIGRILGRFTDRESYLAACAVMLATVKVRETFASTTVEAIVKQAKATAPKAA